MVRFDSVYSWEKLSEVKGMSFDEVVAWIDTLGIDGVDIVGDSEDAEIYLHGYWSDCSPVIGIEDGVVSCWFRAEAWD